MRLLTTLPCLAALLASAPLALIGPAAARALPTSAAGSAQKGGTNAAWAAGPGTDCTRARRKLWQAGEGWIVKAVATCR